MATERKDRGFGHEKHGSSDYGQGASHAASAVAETAKGVADTAKDMMSGAADKAKDLASAAAQKAGQAASFVGDKAEQATAAVGSGMKSLASTIREKTPDSGMLGAATSAVANTLESGGRFLEEEGLSGIADDVTGMIRRNPIPAVLVALGVGFLIARATRS